MKLEERSIRLRKLREQKGLTRHEAAQQLGIVYSYYAKLESGERRGSDEMLDKIAAFYGVTREWLETGMGRSHEFIEYLNTLTDEELDEAYALRQKCEQACRKFFGLDT